MKALGLVVSDKKIFSFRQEDFLKFHFKNLFIDPAGLPAVTHQKVGKK